MGLSRCPGGRQYRCRTHQTAHPARAHLVQWGHRLHRAIEGYAADIIRLIAERYGQDTVQSAWREFNIGAGRQPFCGYDANAELFYSWLFHKWKPAREQGHTVRDETVYGVPPTRAYLDGRSTSLNPLLRMYLEACLATSARFYEVFDCKAGLSFRARDVFTETACVVSEALASTSLQEGDILYAHLIPIGQITIMEAISPRSFPQHSKHQLLQLCQDRAQEQSGPELRQIYLALSANTSR